MKRKTKKGLIFIITSIISLLIVFSIYGILFLTEVKSSIKIRGDKFEHIKEQQSLETIFPQSEATWSSGDLLKAKEYAIEAGINSAIILYKGKLVAEWGETDRVSCLHSARKSILSLLYGIALDKGFLHLDMTLQELGIDDKSKLTEIEKSATIRDLLMCRSGIYLPAEGEVSSMKKLKPERGSHKPGEYWYYNNWDFNALGSILEQQTKISIAQMINDWLSVPLNFEDHSIEDVYRINWLRNKKTNHQQYWVDLSTRDMAKIGQLLLDKGKWKGNQIVPEKYIIESTSPLTFTTPNNNSFYGYSWWVNTPNEIEANGLGGQRIRIYKHLDMVIIMKIFSGSNFLQKASWMIFGNRVTANERRTFEELIKKAGNLEVEKRTFIKLITEFKIKEAFEYFHREKDEDPEVYMFSENRINSFGHQFMEMGRTDEAILLFEIYKNQYPKSANSYEGLGEAYVKKGQNELAIKNYEISFELNPENENAKQMIKKLKSK